MRAGSIFCHSLYTRRVAYDDTQTTYSFILSTMGKLHKKRQDASQQVRNALLQLWQSDSMPEKSGWFSSAQLHSLFCSAGADISKAILSNALGQMKPTITPNKINKVFYYRHYEYADSSDMTPVSDELLDVGNDHFDKSLVDALTNPAKLFTAVSEEIAAAANQTPSKAPSDGALVTPTLVVTPPPPMATVVDDQSATSNRGPTIFNPVICNGIKSLPSYSAYEINKDVVLDKFCVFPRGVIRHPNCSYSITDPTDLKTGGACSKCFNRKKHIIADREPKIFQALSDKTMKLVADLNLLQSFLQEAYLSKPEDEFLQDAETKWLVAKLELTLGRAGSKCRPALLPQTVRCSKVSNTRCKMIYTCPPVRLLESSNRQEPPEQLIHGLYGAIG